MPGGGDPRIAPTIASGETRAPNTELNDRGPRPMQGTEAGSGHHNANNPNGNRSRPTCVECDQRPAQRGWQRCSACLWEFTRGMRRRREAERRLQPLSDFAAAS